MINRLFLIFDHLPGQAVYALPPVDNVYLSIGVDPRVKGSLEQAYRHVGSNAGEGALSSPFCLTVTIHDALDAEALRFITSFLFIPSYLTLWQKPVINLAGAFPDLLHETASSLARYLCGQGIGEPIINIVPESNMTFHTSSTLVAGYESLLQTDRRHNNNIFYYVPAVNAGDSLRSALLSLQQADLEFKQASPQLYALILANQALEKELHLLGAKYSGTEMELRHQKQYVEVLRSDHATKELQDFYNHEYEILPLWYKRFGHIIKVLTGKRTFLSLFRHDVKKYKD